MKVRKTVNVDKDVWWNLKKNAFENNQTMTDYLDGVFKFATEETTAFLRNGASKAPVVQMDNKKTIRQKKIEEVRDKDLTPKISKSDQEMLEMAQELINKKRPDSLMGFNGGYSKEAQLKKKKKAN